MNNFLQQIIKDSRVELDRNKHRHPEAELNSLVSECPNRPDFAEAFIPSGVRIIGELKKASPSKGIIRANFNVVDLAQDLEFNGAAALSVLTEENYFGGSLENLRNVAQVVKIPLLRKDFIFDPYQILEAKVAGASAVLLIGAMLSRGQLHELAGVASEMGLTILGEVHDEMELEMMLDSPVDLIGVNARDLTDFTTSLARAKMLISMIPSERIAIAESAITSRQDIEELMDLGARGFLIGETLMKAPDPGVMLRSLL